MKKTGLVLVFILLGNILSAQVSSVKGDDTPAPVPVSSFFTEVNPLSSGLNFLILADNLPWSSNAVANILTANGETFSVANSAVFPGLNFHDYDVIIILSDQVPAFHTAFSANHDKFEDFVEMGGRLQVHAATCGHNSACDFSVELPGGVYTLDNLDYYNLVADPTHPIVEGVPSPFYGNYASHNYFVNLVPGTKIITVAQSNGEPTTIEYSYGSGTVTATTCTYEWGYNNSQAAGIMLVNNLKYSEEYTPPGPATVPLSGIAMLIAFLGITGFTAFGFARRK